MIILQEFQKVFSQGKNFDSRKIRFNRSYLNIIYLVLSKIQKLDLFGIHKVKQTHQNNCISTQSFHWSLSINDVHFFSPVFNIHNKQLNFRNFRIVLKQLTIDSCCSVTNCHINFIYILNTKRIQKLLLIHFNLQDRKRHFNKTVQPSIAYP